jgi:AcrR family transcriptional regulator
MSVQQRRERERADRRRLIIAAARDVAEAEGWGAVTTRRLAERIEYSQPVLYKHFGSKEEIIEAVAREGFGELASTLRDARRTTASPVAALRALAGAYTDFAAAAPTLYEAMFTLSAVPAFRRPDAPDAAVEAFTELRAAVAPVAGDRDPDGLAELAWSTLHGLVALGRNGRLRPDHEAHRLTLFVEQLTGRAAAADAPAG